MLKEGGGLSGRAWGVGAIVKGQVFTQLVEGGEAKLTVGVRLYVCTCVCLCVSQARHQGGGGGGLGVKGYG